jgi:hypothetical protein
MATGTSQKPIEFARIGNPWLVGKNVNRVVPIYVLHNLLAPNFESDKSIQALKHLVFDAGKALTAGLRERIQTTQEDFTDLQDTAYGLLSPERRVFRDKKNGGAGKHGSLFPIVGGLVANSASDDGLGRRLRELMERRQSDWQDRLCQLLVPSSPTDPATAFAMTLLGGSAGSQAERNAGRVKKKLSGLDLACAEFVDNLILGVADARRIPVIRRLSTGAYLAAMLRMVAGPIADGGAELPLVLVYCGLPPGGAGEPLVRAASKSFGLWVGESWRATANRLHEAIAAEPGLPGARRPEKLRQQVHAVLASRFEDRQKELDAVMASLDPILQGATLSQDWCMDALESDPVQLTRSELARRIRSLGANIGFAGPDRGLRPRLTVDTPLLGVLVKGIVGEGAMEIGAFVSNVAKRFGLVLGVGSDDDIVDKMSPVGSEGYDMYELLVLNQEMLRTRLLRAGLARSYSDSHTEVFCNV